MKILLDRPEFPCYTCPNFVDSEYTTIGKECIRSDIYKGCDILEEWDVDKFIDITDEELNEIGLKWMKRRMLEDNRCNCDRCMNAGKPYPPKTSLSQYFRDLIELKVAR